MKTLFALAIISLCLLTSCNKTGTPTEFGKACDPSNDKKVIEVTGFIDDGGSLFCSNTGGPLTCGFKLKQNAGDKEGISIDIEVGSSSNEVEKPAGSYKREDLKIRDNSGNLIKLGDKYKVTGRITVGGGACFVKVTKIEK